MRLKSILPIVVLLWLTACATQQRTVFNTLFTVGSSVDVAYKGYLDMVVAGKLTTNSLPMVSQSYAAFQNVFNVAIIAVAHNTNAVVPPEVVGAAAVFTGAVESAKKGAP